MLLPYCQQDGAAASSPPTKKSRNGQDCSAARDVLNCKTWLYEAALEAGTTAVHDDYPAAKMPPRIQKIKERIRRLTDDMEQRYKRAPKRKKAAAKKSGKD